MACPFSSGRFKLTHKDESSKEGDHRRIARIKQDELGKPPRQPSVQITSLLGEDGDDLEDTQTLNLKHLRAAVTLLTNPSVLNKRHFYSFRALATVAFLT
jgi:guanylate cyclase soluble subunit alpha